MGFGREASEHHLNKHANTRTKNKNDPSHMPGKVIPAGVKSSRQSEGS